MTGEEFENVFAGLVRLCDDILIHKAKEYATEDRLHNFKVAAEMQNCSAQKALGGMMAKHTVSIYDMLNSEGNYTLEQWNEKIVDHMNYLILLKALLVEGKPHDHTEKVNPNQYTFEKTPQANY